jgi:hypothetical protein
MVFFQNKQNNLISIYISVNGNFLLFFSINSFIKGIYMNRVGPGQNLIPLLPNNNSSAGACRGFFQSFDTIPIKIVLSAGAMICGTFGIAAVITSALYEDFDESKTTTLALSGGLLLAGSFGILCNTSKINSVVKENSFLHDERTINHEHIEDLTRENSLLRSANTLLRSANNAFRNQFGMPTSQEVNATPEVVPTAEDNA